MRKRKKDKVKFKFSGSSNKLNTGHPEGRKDCKDGCSVLRIPPEKARKDWKYSNRLVFDCVF